jgi:hypothetical protein
VLVRIEYKESAPILRAGEQTETEKKHFNPSNPSPHKPYHKRVGGEVIEYACIGTLGQQHDSAVGTAQNDCEGERRRGREEREKSVKQRKEIDSASTHTHTHSLSLAPHSRTRGTLAGGVEGQDGQLSVADGFSFAMHSHPGRRVMERRRER